MLDAVLAAFLVIDHDLDCDLRAAGPAGVRRASNAAMEKSRAGTSLAGVQTRGAGDTVGRCDAGAVRCASRSARAWANVLVKSTICDCTRSTCARNFASSTWVCTQALNSARAVQPSALAWVLRPWWTVGGKSMPRSAWLGWSMRWAGPACSNAALQALAHAARQRVTIAGLFQSRRLPPKPSACTSRSVNRMCAWGLPVFACNAMSATMP